MQPDLEQSRANFQELSNNSSPDAQATPIPEHCHATGGSQEATNVVLALVSPRCAASFPRKPAKGSHATFLLLSA